MGPLVEAKFLIARLNTLRIPMPSLNSTFGFGHFQEGFRVSSCSGIDIKSTSFVAVSVLSVHFVLITQDVAVYIIPFTTNLVE